MIIKLPIGLVLWRS